MAVRAGFDWGVSDDVVWIIDQDNGKCSVTNDIENVVESLLGKSKHSFDDRIKPSDFFIYRDSEGTWDGWNHKTKTFIYLNASSRVLATELIKTKK